MKSTSMPASPRPRLLLALCKMVYIWGGKRIIIQSLFFCHPKPQSHPPFIHSLLSLLLAPQSGALRRGAYKDFHTHIPIPNCNSIRTYEAVFKVPMTAPFRGIQWYPSTWSWPCLTVIITSLITFSHSSTVEQLSGLEFKVKRAENRTVWSFICQPLIFVKYLLLKTFNICKIFILFSRPALVWPKMGLRKTLYLQARFPVLCRKGVRKMT